MHRVGKAAPCPAPPLIPQLYRRVLTARSGEPDGKHDWPTGEVWSRKYTASDYRSGVHGAAGSDVI